MIEQRLQSLEAQIRAANLPDASRQELLGLLAALRAEIAALPPEAAPKPHLLSSLSLAVEEFEAEHPDLAAALNHVAAALSNMGM